MFDSHCHLDASRFDTDRSDIIARAAAAGLRDLLLPGVGEHEWHKALDLATEIRAFKVHVALGVHPQLLPELNADDDQALLSRLEASV